jgi:hypothetical protein
LDADFLCLAGLMLRNLIKGTSVLHVSIVWLIHQFMLMDVIDSCCLFQTFSKIDQYYSGICTANVVPTAAVCIHGSHDVHKVVHLLPTGD